MIYLHIVTYACTVLFLVVVINATVFDPKKLDQRAKEAAKKLNEGLGRKGLRLWTFPYNGPVSFKASNRATAQKKYRKWAKEQQTIKDTNL